KEATDDDAVSKRPAISALGLHLNPVPAHEVGGPALNDVLTSVDQLVDLDTHRVPRFKELLDPTQDLIRSSGDPAPLTEGRRAVEFEVRAQVAPPLVPIPAIPGVPGSPHDLHVLLRHRLLRKPGGFECFLLVVIRGELAHSAVTEGPNLALASRHLDPVTAPTRAGFTGVHAVLV